MKEIPKLQYLYGEILSPSALDTKGDNTAFPDKIAFYLTKHC